MYLLWIEGVGKWFWKQPNSITVKKGKENHCFVWFFRWGKLWYIYHILWYLHLFAFLKMVTLSLSPSSWQLLASVQLQVRQGGVSLKAIQSMSSSQILKHSLSSTLCSTVFCSGHFSDPVRCHPEKNHFTKILFHTMENSIQYWSSLIILF